jgi:hypothetical protein
MALSIVGLRGLQRQLLYKQTQGKRKVVGNKERNIFKDFSNGKWS